jgi:hypothetical protein
VLGKVLPKPLAILGAVGGNAVVQTGQEVGQSLLLPAAEEIAAALDKDIKGRNWREVLKKEREALGDYFGISLVISLVAAAGGGIARHTERAELAKTLQDRHGLELAGFEAAAVDAVVKAAASDPEKAADLLHASWQETSVEKRRANAEAKLEAMQAPGEQGKPGAGTQVAEGDPAAAPPVPEAETAGGGEKRASAFEPDEELVNRAVEEAVARGNMANTDEVRSLIPSYNEADPLTRDAEYHRQASALNDRVIKRLLEREPVTRSAILLAGGAGSGKSSILKRLGIERDVVIDTTLSWEDSARQIVAEIEASGRTPVVLYVHRPFAKAFEDGVIDRYLEGKKQGAPRLVPLRVAAEAHVGAQETVIALAAGGVDVSVFDNSGRIGEFVERDIEFIKGNRYTTANEGRRESGTGTTTATDRGGVESSIVGGDGESPGADQAGLRGRAEERLIAEGNAILERYRREGKLTDAEVHAFRGEGGGTDDSADGGGSAPPDGGGDVPGPSNRTAAPPGSGGDAGGAELPSPEDERQPAIRRLTSLGTGQEVHVFEAPDGTRSEHGTLDEAFDAWEAWEDRHPARDEGVVELEDAYLSERHAKKIKRHEKGSKAWKRAVTDSILEPILRKSSTGGNLPKGRKRKELLSDELELTADERAILQSPHEITVVYKDGRLVNARTLYHEQLGPSMHGYEAGHTFTHQHPSGNPPSLLDLDEIMKNPRQILRIVAEQKDGSIDLYELKVDGELSPLERGRMFKLFKAEVDGVPDTPEQRLLAMELTVKVSGGKLKFRSRRFDK